MSAFDGLQRASFDGIEFPIKTCRIAQDGRHHVHIYLKTPGGATEKMGRGLYMITMAAVFDTNVKGYGALWPDKLGQLRQRSEQQKTAALVIPTIGTIQAWIPKWEQEADFDKIRSGERAPITFQEDASQVFLAQALSTTNAVTIGNMAKSLDSLADGFSPKPDIFEQINNAVNGVLAIKDQGELFGALAASKIEALAGLLQLADSSLKELQDPVNWQVVDALHDLLDATITLGKDITGNGNEARIFVVPRLMTVSEISSAIYGDGTHATELMQNNALDDPFNVPAGDRLLYFKNAA